jgi:hypothetical protein
MQAIVVDLVLAGPALEPNFSLRPSGLFLLRAFERSQDDGGGACTFIKRAERQEHSYCAEYGGS